MCCGNFFTLSRNTSIQKQSPVDISQVVRAAEGNQVGPRLEAHWDFAKHKWGKLPVPEPPMTTFFSFFLVVAGLITSSQSDQPTRKTLVTSEHLCMLDKKTTAHPNRGKLP